MQFKPISTARYETNVEVVPSSPDGYFRIDDDPFVLPYSVGSIALRGIKPRHVKALKKGNESVMDRYVVTDPEHPDFVSFSKCEPGIPDPLQPVRSRIYVRRTQEVHLDRSRKIDDGHRAIGEWWAQRLLEPVVDIGNGISIPDDMRSYLQKQAGDFALILAGLSRNSNIHHISADYHPDHILRNAADMAFVPAPVSLGSYTSIVHDGNVVQAREGKSGEITQIWPPISEEA